MPTNLNYPEDHDNPETSSVLPARLCKIDGAKRRSERQVILSDICWPRREFLYSHDLGEATAFLTHLPDTAFRQRLASVPVPLFDVSAREDQSVARLAALIAEALGNRGVFLESAANVMEA